MYTQFDTSRIITTKLVPFYRVKGYIRREALFNRLQTALEHKLAIVSAAAGYGKTSLLSDFFSTLKDRGVRAAWLTLDDEDSAPLQFLGYLFASLQNAGITLPEYYGAAERSFQDMPVRSVLASLFKSVEALGEPVVLIVDDYHRAACPELNELFEWLVRFSPPELHIIVASREHPPIMREDLRVRGDLLEFTSQDLAFTPDDVKLAFASSGDQQIDMKEIIRLTDRTEGWPLAVELALKWSLGEQHKAREISDFSGRTTDLARYLSEQLLSRLPDETQLFLLQTSILSRISGELANSVTGRDDSWTLLEKLEQQNVFLLPMDGDNKWFRYHPLVAEFLTDRLRRLGGQDISQLHSRAAQWFGGQGYLGEALGHAALAGDEDYVASLLEQAGGWRLILVGRISLIHNYLPQPGSVHLENRPRLQLARAFYLIKCGEIDAARRYFDHIRQALKNDDLPMDVRLEEQMVGDLISEYEDAPVKWADIAGNERLIASLPADDNILLALANETLAHQYYYYGMLDESLNAVSRTTEYYQKIRSLYGEVFTIFHKSRIALAQGKLKESEKLLDDLIEPVTATFGETSDLAANLATFRAEILYEKNDVAGAYDLLFWALPHMEASDSWFEVCFSGYLTAAASAYSLHGLDAALEILARARITAQQRHLMRLHLAADLCEIDLSINAGNLAHAEALAATTGLFDQASRLGRESPLSRKLDYRIGITAARLNRALRRPSVHMEALENLARDQGFVRQLMEIEILMALDYFDAGQPEKAVTKLGNAVEAALFEGNLRVFAQEGEGLLPLLELALSNKTPLQENRFRDNFIKTIQRLISQNSGPSETPLPGCPLPLGEFETLRILGTGLTNKEIAIKLNISPSTVKYRLKSVFAKLAVSSRKEAVKLARDKGWLDQDSIA